MLNQTMQLQPFHLLFETDSLKNKKLEDHRSFCGAMFVLSGLFGALLWIWDYVTDAAGALNTIELRSGYLLLILVAVAFKLVKSRRVLAAISLLAILLSECLFMAILNRLDTGMTYGIGGFMIFVFIPMLLLQGFSLLFNLLQSVLVGVLPHVLALSGLAPGFQHDHYAVLIWPTISLMMLIYFATARSYWQRREFEIALEHMSHTDPMTGLHNRRYFVPLLKKEIARCARLKHRVSLMILDIDHFKKINDTYGHQTGDLVICMLSVLCRQESREIDAVARLGGEEFAVMLPETTVSDAAEVAERIRVAVENSRVKSLNDEEFSFTVSIGVAEQPTGEMSEEKLVGLADEALYQAKESGRNRVQVKNID